MEKFVLTDDMLREAAKECDEAILASLPEPSECTHEFSPRYQERKQRIIDAASRGDVDELHRIQEEMKLEREQRWARETQESV